MQAKQEKQGTPRCFTLVMGCCATGKCTNKEGSCGCADGCTCPADSNCKRTDVRKQPDLGGGNSLLYAGALVALAAAGAVAYAIAKKQE